jgi:hypothetical protein
MAVRLSMAFHTSAESRHIQQAQYDFSRAEEKIVRGVMLFGGGGRQVPFYGMTPDASLRK